MLSRLGIGTRLIGSTAGAMLAMGAIGAIGVASTAAVNDMMQRSLAEAQKPVQQLSRVNELMQENFRQLYAATLHNPTLKAAGYHNHPVTLHTGAIEKNIAQIGQVVREYKDSPAGALFAEDLERYNAARAKFVQEGLLPGMQLAAADTAEKYSDLGVFVTTTILPRYNEAKKLAEDLLARHVQLSQDIATTSEKQYAAAKATILLGCLIIAVVVFAAAAVVIRSITKPIKDLTGIMMRLAENDTSAAVPGVERGDEVGAMARTVEVFKENAIAKTMLEEEQGIEEERRREADERQRAREAAIMAEVSDVIQAAGRGDLGRRLDLSGKDGFLLSLCQGVNNLTSQTEGALQEMAKVLGGLARGDLTGRVEGTYEGLFGRLKDDMNGTAGKLSETVDNIVRTAAEIANAASEVAEGSADLAERTEQQASNLEETSAAMEELSGTVRQNAANAQEANGLAAETRDKAQSGGEVAGNAVTAMGRIEESSRRIGEIMALIDEIAFQTNLLALNAAVEAARAGEAGKGFAVVAQEVRNLAQRSGQASKEIKALITQSSAEVQGGATLVKNAGRTLDEIVTSVRKVADIVAEIASASKEQASGIAEVNSAVNNMDDMTQRNAAMVEESTAAARSLQEQAQELARAMSFFRTA